MHMVTLTEHVTQQYPMQQHHTAYRLTVSKIDVLLRVQSQRIN